MVVSTSTDQPQTLSIHQKFSAKTNNETQSPKSYKNNLQTLRNPLKQEHPKKTHTRKNRNKTTLAKNNQQGVCIHRCFDSPLKSATPGLHPTPLPWASSFQRSLIIAFFLFQKQILPPDPPLSDHNFTHKTKRNSRHSRTEEDDVHLRNNNKKKFNPNRKLLRRFLRFQRLHPSRNPKEKKKKNTHSHSDTQQTPVHTFTLGDVKICAFKLRVLRKHEDDGRTI